MRVLIADDHSVVRQGVSLILKEAFEGIELGHSETVEETVEMLKKKDL